MLSYRRHANGGGKLYKEQVFVSRDSFVDADSEIYGDCTIHHSRIHKSHISNSQLSLTDSVDSVITSGSSLTSSQLYKSTVLNSILCGGASVRDIFLTEVTVDGPAQLVGPWALRGPFYVREGTWTRPPRGIVLEDESGIHAAVTESVPGYAYIACEHKPIADWLKRGERIGLALGWSEDLVSKARMFMEELADCPLPMADERIAA